MSTVFNTHPIDSDYQILEEIGSGQFATVRRCIQLLTGQEFAAKFIRKKRIAASRRGVLFEDIQREVNILNKLNHENIVKLYNVYDNGSEVILILELVKGGELFDFIAGKDGLEEWEAIAFIRQILLGLKHMHDKEIVHLDLKPENIMLLDRDTQSLKLIDFGLSRVVDSNSEIREILGTPEFVAPEIINYEPITLATDLWSVGVITFNLLSGASPFLGETKQETFSNITAVEYSFESNFSELAKDFIWNLLQKDGRKRLTVGQCLQHPWISNNSVIIKNISSIKFNMKYRHFWKKIIYIVIICLQLSRRLKNRSHSVTSLVTSFPNRYFLKDEQDENFVLAALFGAVEEGNLNGLHELLNISKIDINQANQHGETAIHVAAGLGQLSILKFLIEKGADITLVDNHGDSAIYWAARQGHTQAIRYLYEKGLEVDSKNKAGETAVHVAARYGHADAIEQLCKCGANVNVVDDHGETALHIAVWHGFPRIVHVLGEVGVEGNVKNKEDETALHCAAARGHIESVRCLLEIGVDLNPLDKNGCTALHLALRRHHVVVAMMLISGGCDFELTDGVGERAIHIAAREGLLQVCQQLISLSCKVNVCNKSGLYPIHLAAKYGNIEVVRCLCLAPPCNVEQKNRDGITAEISALAHGFKDIADLLARVKHENVRSEHINQLSHTTQPLNRVKLKFLGHSGVGKTTLIESLKCGYFGSWFRRSSRGIASLTTVNSNKSSPTAYSNQSANTSSISISSSKSSLDSSPPSTPTNGHRNCINNIINQNGGCHNNSSIFEFSCWDSETSTRCIDVQQISVSGVGDMSVWDYSGCESYLQVYDHFLNEPNCIHAILFRACDRIDIQMNQVLYWLNFLQTRLPTIEPLTYKGKSQLAAKVIFIATHADLINNSSNSLSSGGYNLNTIINSRNVSSTNGECGVTREVNTVHQVAMEKFSHVFDIHDSVLILDSHSVGGNPMKKFKNYLHQQRTKLLETMPNTSGFLDSVSSTLVNWRKVLASFPVLTYSQFVNMIRDQINPLASENHIRDTIRCLQYTGDIYYIKSKSDQDLLVLCPKWLTNQVIGVLLNNEQIMRSPISGRCTVDEMQDLFPSVDALDLLQILENLSLCVQCDDHEGDIEYEFGCFIKQERPELDMSQSNGLSSDGKMNDSGCGEHDLSSGNSSGMSNGTSDMVLAGVRLQCDPDTPSGTLLTCLFARLQIMVRSLVQENSDLDNQLSLEQFRNAARLRSGQLEAMIMPTILSCSLQYEAIELRVKGPKSKSADCFHFFYDLLAFIESGIASMCPGLLLHRYYLSPSELAACKLNPLTYSPSELIAVVLNCDKPLQQTIPSPSRKGRHGEKLADIISFGCVDLSTYANDLNQRVNGLSFAKLRDVNTPQINHQMSLNPTLVPNLHINNVSLPIKQKLCNLLDPPESMGKDWCMLGIKLGLTDKLPKLDPGSNSNISPTWKVLEECCHNPDCTIAVFIQKLKELGRMDAAELFLNSVPILKVFPLFYSMERCSNFVDESSVPPSATSSASQASSSNLSR